MPDISTEAAAPTLGDCILHVTHHEMRPECWRTVIETYAAFAEQCGAVKR